MATPDVGGAAGPVRYLENQVSRSRSNASSMMTSLTSGGPWRAACDASPAPSRVAFEIELLVLAHAELTPGDVEAAVVQPLRVERLPTRGRVGDGLGIRGVPLAGHARGDGVVRSRLDLHVVGRVGEEEVDRHPIQQPVEVGFGAGITAEQPMVAEEPEVTRLRDRLVRRLGHVVGVCQAVLRLRPVPTSRASPLGPRS